MNTIDPAASITVLRRADSSDMPTILGMPTLTTTTKETFSTPAVSVPPSTNNPYILKNSQPLGTVFIAVGSVVAAILIAFMLYHLFKSLSSLRMAKKTLNNEKFSHHRFSAALTPLTSGYFNTEYQGSVAKLPLLTSNKSAAGGSQVGDNSTIFNYDGSQRASHHDLTQMFVSPTREVMTHHRTKSHNNGSVTNVSSLYGRSTTNLANPSPASNRHLQAMPNVYINDEVSNSEYSVAQSPPQRTREPGLTPRKQLPSMYLEDLIDN